MKQNEINYFEPADYFPEEIRKKYKLGEYSAEEEFLEDCAGIQPMPLLPSEKEEQ